jgi:hypothetical protein
MTSRWLAGLAIFALGFGCAQMMKVTAANAADDGMPDEEFRFVDHGDSYELINTGTKRLLIMVELKEGVPLPEPQIEAMEGSAIIMKEGLAYARIASLEELDLSERECNPIYEDCVEPEAPFPSPGPRPRMEAYFVHPARR